jgi:hypothetical protein
MMHSDTDTLIDCTLIHSYTHTLYTHTLHTVQGFLRSSGLPDIVEGFCDPATVEGEQVIMSLQCSPHTPPLTLPSRSSSHTPPLTPLLCRRSCPCSAPLTLLPSPPLTLPSPHTPPLTLLPSHSPPLQVIMSLQCSPHTPLPSHSPPLTLLPSHAPPLQVIMSLQCSSHTPPLTLPSPHTPPLTLLPSHSPPLTLLLCRSSCPCSAPASSSSPLQGSGASKSRWGPLSIFWIHRSRSFPLTPGQVPLQHS